MERPEKVLEKTEEIIEKGEKASAKKISQEMNWMEQDVHRCLNILEKKGKIKTDSKNFLGKKIRIVQVYR